MEKKKKEEVEGGQSSGNTTSSRFFTALGEQITLLSVLSAIFRPELFQKHSRHETKHWDAGEISGRR